MERVLVVLNPSARRGGAGGRKLKLETALRAAGLGYDLVETTGPGDAQALARASSGRGYTVILAAGGDGTINEVVNGMAEAASPGMGLGKLAIFPIGTGNDLSFALLSHALGCPRSPEEVAAAITGGRTRRIDVGLLRVRGASGEVSRYFSNNIGIGLEASVTLATHRIRGLRGPLLYLAAALLALRRYKTPWAEINWETEDGQNQSLARRITLVSIGNGVRAGGGFRITPDARLDDGLLDAAVARDLTRRRILVLLPQAIVGAHTRSPAVQMIRCRRLALRFDQPLPVHLDGEVVAEDAEEVEATLEPGRLEIIV